MAPYKTKDELEKLAKSQANFSMGLYSRLFRVDNEEVNAIIAKANKSFQRKGLPPSYYDNKNVRNKAHRDWAKVSRKKWLRENPSLRQNCLETEPVLAENPRLRRQFFETMLASFIWWAYKRNSRRKPDSNRSRVEDGMPKDDSTDDSTEDMGDGPVNSGGDDTDANTDTEALPTGNHTQRRVTTTRPAKKNECRSFSAEHRLDTLAPAPAVPAAPTQHPRTILNNVLVSKHAELRLLRADGSNRIIGRLTAKQLASPVPPVEAETVALTSLCIEPLGGPIWAAQHNEGLLDKGLPEIAWQGEGLGWPVVIRGNHDLWIVFAHAQLDQPIPIWVRLSTAEEFPFSVTGPLTGL